MTPTPIKEVLINRYVHVMLKLEKHTVPGSHKGRFAPLIAHQLKNHRVQRVMIMSSGNTADAIAYYTQDANIELIVITDVLSPCEFQDQLQQYHHVRLEIVDHADENGSHMAARRERRQEILKKDHSIVEINQYRDSRIPWIYENTLYKEIDEQLKGDIGALFIPVGTGGLLNGALKYSYRNHKHWRIFGVDAVGSKLHWVPPDGQRRTLSGYGNAGPTELIMDIWKNPYHYSLVHVADAHAVAACHRLFDRGSLFLGPSSGATIAAIEIILRNRPTLIPNKGNIVAVMPDGGEQYRSTIWDDNWLISHGLGHVVASGI